MISCPVKEGCSGGSVVLLSLFLEFCLCGIGVPTCCPPTFGSGALSCVVGISPLADSSGVGVNVIKFLS